ncbi:MAG: GNAT family N-acetyltransferase [Planctomycetes bacterium]|nr:GNAT family N-acetyltransferase [Planctomycetota bacterium]
MSMDGVRQATKDDIPQIARLWQETRPYDNPELASLQRFFENRDWFLPEATLVVECDGAIVGFIAGAVGPAKQRGHVPLFFVHADHLAGDIPDRLLRRVLDELRCRDVDTVDTDLCPDTGLSKSGYDSRYVDILDVFRRSGFEALWRYHELDVAFVKDLTGFEFPAWVSGARARLEREGVTFDFCRAECHEPYLDFMHTHFAKYSAWCRGAQEYVEGRGGEQIRILAFHDRKIVGFTECHKPKDWSIYSTGVREDLRRRKIGTVLIFLAVEEMHRRGADRLYLGHAIYEFYKELGGEVVYRFMVMKKTL